MPVKRFESSISVLDAAKTRIKNLFACGCKIYLSFSSGKDSLCMSSLTYDLILQGEIDKSLLTIIFVDEEGLYPSMVDAAMRWRQKFMSIGVPFIWLCLPMKQVSVIDHLSAAESWITWEPGKEQQWIRCFCVTNPTYKHYGARGITICDEWNDFAVFRDWALSHGYKDELSIERKDVDGNYCPENCSWIPRNEQAMNTHNCKRYSYGGVTLTHNAWARHLGIAPSTLTERIRRYGIDTALSVAKLR